MTWVGAKAVDTNATARICWPELVNVTAVEVRIYPLDHILPSPSSTQQKPEVLITSEYLIDDGFPSPFFTLCFELPESPTYRANIASNVAQSSFNTPE